MVFYCKYCPFCCSLWKEHMRHVFQCHSSTPNFVFSCGISGCVQTFKTFSAIQSHLQRKHSGCDFSQLESYSENVEDLPQLESGIEGSSLGESIATIASSGTSLSQVTESKRSTALLLLNLKERHRITQSAIDFSVGQIRQMMTNVLDDIKVSVKNRVGDVEIDDCFDVDPFSELDTEYLQSKFYRENFNLIEPISIELGTELVSLHTGTKRRLGEKKTTYQYVPFLDGLKSLLSNQEILDEVLTCHSRDDQLIADYCDGTLFKQHSLFGSKPNSLQIIVYFDEVEICNPLGGQSGIHKLGLFYYVLGNLRPELRSTHRCIQLIACVECPALDKYGFDKVLEKFITDVNTLCEVGISVSVGGRVYEFYGTVLLVLADTLAAHQLGGFKVGVGFALRICRDCFATRDMIQHKFKENDFVIRDPASHASHCSLLDGALGADDSVTYGINSSSCLNEIKNFDVANFQMPQDVMHILFEGVLPMEAKLMLHSFIEDGYISLDLLNERIQNFTYSRVEARTKPPKPLQMNDLIGTKKLHLSAAQMWNFAVLLPLMIGDKVPEDNSKWECFLLLLEITKVCTAQVTSTEAADYLRVLIEDHHRLFLKCYPDVSLTPKTHYMVHFPRLLTYVGPMVVSWCMRMEAKNSYFKRIAQTGNFKNIPLSVAKRHQRLLCGYLQGKFFTYNEMESGPCMRDVVKLSDDIYSPHILEALPQTDMAVTISRPNWISIYGERYYREEYVHVSFQRDDLPSFGKIIDVIVVTGSTPLVIVELYRTDGINSHVSSYQVSRTNFKKAVLLSNLASKHPYYVHTYIGDSKHYIVMRSHVPKM